MKHETFWLPLIALSSQCHDLRKRGHLGSLFAASQYAWAYKTVLSLAQSGGRILDWGCGNGHFSYFLLESGYQDVHAYGFRRPELMDQLMKWPECVTFHNAQKADASSIPLGSELFTAVLSIGVLEHVRETGGTELASLREINRLLERGGVFICCHLPNRLSMIEAVSRLVPGKYHHRYLFDRQKIEALCVDSGFSLESLSLYGILPRNIFSGPLRPLGNYRPLCFFMNKLDGILSILLKPYCQNFAFVARKI